MSWIWVVTSKGSVLNNPRIVIWEGDENFDKWDLLGCFYVTRSVPLKRTEGPDPSFSLSLSLSSSGIRILAFTLIHSHTMMCWAEQMSKPVGLPNGAAQCYTWISGIMKQNNPLFTFYVTCIQYFIIVMWNWHTVSRNLRTDGRKSMSFGGSIPCG